jgi:uncharacterized membrane protein YfcA
MRRVAVAAATDLPVEPPSFAALVSVRSCHLRRRSALGLFVFAVIILGAVAGWAIGKRLPTHHLTDAENYERMAFRAEQRSAQERPNLSDN